MMLSPEWRETFYAPTTLYRLGGSREAGVSIDPCDPRDRRGNDLSESDLIEEDASIFQYKVEIGADGTGQGYARWLHEKHRYTMVFKFLSRLLGPENAYTALPPLVRADFARLRDDDVSVTLMSMRNRCPSARCRH